MNEFKFETIYYRSLALQMEFSSKKRGEPDSSSLFLFPIIIFISTFSCTVGKLLTTTCMSLFFIFFWQRGLNFVQAIVGGNFFVGMV